MSTPKWTDDTAPAFSFAALRAPERGHRACRRGCAGSWRRPRGLVAIPLAPWEREGLKSALLKAGLAGDDIGAPGVLFWRFETFEDIPVGFGGIEVHGRDALLRSLVVLPPLRQLGMGAAIVGVLEIAQRARTAEKMYI